MSTEADGGRVNARNSARSRCGTLIVASSQSYICMVRGSGYGVALLISGGSLAVGTLLRHMLRGLQSLCIIVCGAESRVDQI